MLGRHHTGLTTLTQPRHSTPYHPNWSPPVNAILHATRCTFQGPILTRSSTRLRPHLSSGHAVRYKESTYAIVSGHLSPNPILNIPRRNEDVATDTIYSNVPAIDDGSTAAQFFIGRQLHYRSILPMGHSDKHFAPMLMDVIRQCGAMDRLISDNATRAQISKRVKDLL
jgi:hypothetical protein